MILKKISLMLLTVLFSTSCLEIKGADDTPGHASSSSSAHATPPHITVDTPPQTPASPGAPDLLSARTNQAEEGHAQKLSGSADSEAETDEETKAAHEAARASNALLQILREQTESLGQLPAQSVRLCAALERIAQATEEHARASKASEETQKQQLYTQKKQFALEVAIALQDVSPETDVTDIYSRIEQDPLFLAKINYAARLEEEQKERRQNPKPEPIPGNGPGAGSPIVPDDLPPAIPTRWAAFKYSLTYVPYSPAAYGFVTAVAHTASNSSRVPQAIREKLSLLTLGSGFATGLATVRTLAHTVSPQRSDLLKRLKAAHAKQQLNGSQSGLRGSALSKSLTSQPTGFTDTVRN